MFKALVFAAAELRQKKPLVLCLTNTVTMDFVANCLLALGAAPMISQSKEELADLISISHAVNLNIGTLDTEFSERAQMAVMLAKQYEKPIILDPVGVGASKIRTQFANLLLPSCDIIRGNASEILALSGLSHQTLGVESTEKVPKAMMAAEKINHLHNCTVVISGEIDFITDGVRQEMLSYGCALMSQITGMGCALTAVISAFRALNIDSFQAASLATAYFGLCGTIAAHKTEQPGSFRSYFIDALYACDVDVMANHMDARR